MNKVVENLDRKKFEMLRNFIATPDRDMLIRGARKEMKRMGQREEEREEERRSSGSGSSINTVKNAPI